MLANGWPAQAGPQCVASAGLQLMSANGNVSSLSSPFLFYSCVCVAVSMAEKWPAGCLSWQLGMAMAKAGSQLYSIIQ